MALNDPKRVDTPTNQPTNQLTNMKTGHNWRNKSANLESIKPLSEKVNYQYLEILEANILQNDKKK